MARSPTITVNEDGSPVTRQYGIGGGLEGAERTERETVFWNPQIVSPDSQINPIKELADARTRDSIQNDGYAAGAVTTHKDSIVGSQYVLNAQPNWKVIGGKGATEEWAQEFQETVEDRFNLISDATDCWLDAQRTKTLTDMVRLAVGGFCYTGEVLGTAEWIREKQRPFHTAVQMISPSRLCNPDGRWDEKNMRRGIEQNRYGAPQRYWFKTSHPGDWFSGFDPMTWVPVDAYKPWGRRQVIHIIEQQLPDQSRGISEMVSVLKSMRMTKKFKDITLQNAVVNASYAAAVESELPSEMVYKAMGAGGNTMQGMLNDYLAALGQYVGTAGNLKVDGVKIPHLFPGTKLALKPMGTPGGVGTDFEQSLLRHIASALGLSYEQFSRDYTKTNYSSARASMAETWKFMQARKKMVADRFAKMIYVLWLEEELNAGNLPLPKGMTVGDLFYTDAYKREALCQCDWIGASRGQIDEKKETDSAVLRVNNNLSTYEMECARLGLDWRKVARQRARENQVFADLKITPIVQGADKAASAQEERDDKAREEREEKETA